MTFFDAIKGILLGKQKKTCASVDDIARARAENALYDNQKAFTEKHDVLANAPSANRKLLRSIGSSPFADLEVLMRKDQKRANK
jgi:hypothetical protein